MERGGRRLAQNKTCRHRQQPGHMAEKASVDCSQPPSNRHSTPFHKGGPEDSAFGEGIQGFVPSVGLISLGIISSSIHAAVKGRIPFSVAERCFIIYIYRSLFMHSSVGGISVLSTFWRDSVTEEELTRPDKEFE
ncbi:unnamed protein product [Rangifer tarandus platyrhynchus]|uniref:Uncharacterized protein n=1 Tax=Rangifer tarandus platyrhynchus TaxID=3082113 RepID=A0AC60A1X0_RANTA